MRTQKNQEKSTAQGVTSTQWLASNFNETIPLRKCEDCIHYKMIDSGYGYCLRFPPRIVAIRRHWRMLYRNEYPEVAWCENACGEFSMGR